MSLNWSPTNQSPLRAHPHQPSVQPMVLHLQHRKTLHNYIMTICCNSNIKKLYITIHKFLRAIDKADSSEVKKNNLTNGHLLTEKVQKKFDK